MAIIPQILEYIGSLSIRIISFLGYGGVFILMAFESMILPVPSELVMPFAGFLAAEGSMNFYLAVLFSSLGSLSGSLLFYYIGRYGGNKLVKLYGKYLLLDEEDLLKTEHWFSKNGEKTIFIGRFIPVVRHLISIPAGMGRMNIKKFIIYTLAGATLWNAFLAYLGFLLGKNWTVIRHYSEYISVPVAAALLIAGIYFVYRFVRHKLDKRARIPR